MLSFCVSICIAVICLRARTRFTPQAVSGPDLLHCAISLHPSFVSLYPIAPNSRRNLTLRAGADGVQDEAKKSEEGYLKFYEQFGLNLKEGVAMDQQNGPSLAKLLRSVLSRTSGTELEGGGSREQGAGSREQGGQDAEGEWLRGARRRVRMEQLG
eukprot:3513165-Rhodomonas_salina.3